MIFYAVEEEIKYNLQFSALSYWEYNTCFASIEVYLLYLVRLNLNWENIEYIVK